MGLLILRSSQAPAGLNDDPQPRVTAREGRDAAASVLSLSFSSSLRPVGTFLPVPSSFTSFSLDDCSHSVSLSPHDLFLTLALGEGRKVAFLFSFSFVSFFFFWPSSGGQLVYSVPLAALLSHRISSPVPLILFLPLAPCPCPLSPSLIAAHS